MVLSGVRVLEDKSIISVSRDGHVNEYELTVSEDDTNWGKLPYELMRKNLPGISNKGVVTLAALKVYLLLISKRPNQNTAIAIGHHKIRDETGIQARHVRPALDILINHALIRISVDEKSSHYGNHNVYSILGLKV